MNVPFEINELYQLLAPDKGAYSTDGDDWQTMVGHIVQLIQAMVDRNEIMRLNLETLSKRVEDLEKTVMFLGNNPSSRP